MSAEKNFWLWGTWGKRVLKAPFLTQKIPGKIRDVVIGANFIIVLKEDGQLESWGEDKMGCLGQSPDTPKLTEPKLIDLKEPVVDVQYGRHHLLARTSTGKVYAWGENNVGQLGLGHTENVYEPNQVKELAEKFVVQVLAVDNMSYALTREGVVLAWGENSNGTLGLDHSNKHVPKPEPMLDLQRSTVVKRLGVKECSGTGSGKAGKTIIAFVELADDLPAKDLHGGFDRPLGEPKGGGGKRGGWDQVPSEDEKQIFEGVDLMRRIMDNTQEWWSDMLKVRHGAPYDDDPTQVDENTDNSKDDNCTTRQLDRYVSLDNLERASYELSMLIHNAKAQLLEIRSKKGTKNVKFMLSMFMDDCKLRNEKIRRTISSRQLMDHKRQLLDQRKDDDWRGVTKGSKDLEERLNHASACLVGIKRKVQNAKVYDIFGEALQQSLLECIECKLQIHELEFASRSGQPSQVIIPHLRTIKERWEVLKRFSIYNLFQECNLRGQNVSFNSDDEMLAFLVHSSDSKIDQIIGIMRDDLISRDLFVPALCYELLTENAELRKMCNTYQFKVLLMRQGKEKQGRVVGN